MAVWKKTPPYAPQAPMTHVSTTGSTGSFWKSCTLMPGEVLLRTWEFCESSRSFEQF